MNDALVISLMLLNPFAYIFLGSFIVKVKMALEINVLIFRSSINTQKNQTDNSRAPNYHLLSYFSFTIHESLLRSIFLF